MKKTILFHLLFAPCTLFAQEIKLSSGIGYTILKAKNMKKNALVTSNKAGTEFMLNEFWHLGVMAGIQTVKFGYELKNDSSIYVSKHYFCLPISIKNYSPVSKKASIYLDLGVSFSYEYSTKNEIFTSNTYNKISNNNNGSSIGLNLSFGFKTQIARKTFIDIGLFIQNDIASFYKNENDKTKNDMRMLSLTLFRQLKQ